MSTIPASSIVAVTPSVVSAGGSALDLVGLMLTTSSRVPIGTVQEFSGSASVASYFGGSSNEAAEAAVYFGGFDGSLVKPGKLLVAQYPTGSVGAYLRGGNLGTMSLTSLQGINGVLGVVVDGTLRTGSINLSGASSFSNAATLIQAGLAGSGAAITVSFDSLSSGFVVNSGLTGTASSIAFGSGAIAAPLALTALTGAVLSQGTGPATPSAYMTSLSQVTQNWATFMLLFDPDGGAGNAQKLLFAQWTSQQNNRYAFVCWDTDATPSTQNPATGSMGYLIGPNGSNYSGTMLVWEPSPGESTYRHAAFVLGIAASVSFSALNGRTDFCFRTQSGLVAGVTAQPARDALVTNGYNFLQAIGTANQTFVHYYPGSISGPFLWADSFIDQIWLNNQFQLALVTLLTTMPSIPYNAAGRALIETALSGPIQAGLNFGAFRAGVTLSASQIAAVNAAAGRKIDTTLSQQGWYLQVLPASAQARAARQSPPCNFWYCDGQDVQQINLASIEIQ